MRFLPCFQYQIIRELLVHSTILIFRRDILILNLFPSPSIGSHLRFYSNFKPIPKSLHLESSEVSSNLQTYSLVPPLGAIWGFRCEYWEVNLFYIKNHYTLPLNKQVRSHIQCVKKGGGGSKESTTFSLWILDTTQQRIRTLELAGNSNWKWKNMVRMFNQLSRGLLFVEKLFLIYH